MKIGIAIPNFGKFANRENIKEITLNAEELGFDSLWCSDHVIIPNSHKIGFGSNFYEPVTTLAYLASLTKRISLGTSVIVIPYRNPVVFAKLISTIDQISDGRVILGIGSGWLKEEFDALGIDFNNKSDITEEYLEIIKELWYSDNPQYSGKYLSFSDIVFSPRPTNTHRIPIWMGGNYNSSIDRAIKLCTGWHAVGLTPYELQNKTDYIKNKLKTSEQKTENFIISIRSNLQITDNRKLIENNSELLRGNKEKITDSLNGYKNSGADHMIIYILSSEVSGFLDHLQTLAEEIRPQIL